MNANSQNLPEDQISDRFAFSPSDLGKVISASIKPFIVFALLALGLSFMYLKGAKPVYSIVSEIVVERKKPTATSDSSGESVRFNATQAEILKSPLVVNAALEKNPLPQELSEKAADANLSASAWIKEQLIVSTITGTQVIAIAFETSHPEHGVGFLDSVVNQYLKLSRNTDVDEHKGTLGLLEKSASDLRIKLAGLQEEYQTVRRSNSSIGEGDEALSLHKQNAEDYNVQRMEAQQELVRRQAALAEFDRVLADRDMHLLSQRYVKGEIGRAYAQAEVRLAQLRTNFQDAHPDVTAARMAVEDLRSRLLSEASEQRRVLLSSRNVSRGEANRLEQQYNLAIDKAKSADLAQLDQKVLVAEIESTQQLLEAELARINDRSLAIGSLNSGQSGTVAEVIRKPSIPLEAIWPRPKLVYAMALFAAAICAGLFGLISFTRSKPQRQAFKPIVLHTQGKTASELIREAAHKRVLGEND